MRKVLALDFDGVLHPAHYSPEGKLCRLELLEVWLRVNMDVQVLLSTSWREYFSAEDLREMFSEDLQPQVIGVTPMIHRILGPLWKRSPAELEASKFERQWEIEHWIRDHAPGVAWVALDDQRELFEPACVHLIACDSIIGLTDADLYRLNSLLREV